MSMEEKSASGGKVIGGTVSAEAGPAGVAVNQGVSYAIREAIHHRITYDPATGQEIKRETLIENQVTEGQPPEGFHVFTGLGTLEAKITVVEGQPQQAHREDYRFPVGAETLEQAWSVYEGFALRGAEAAKADFRRRYAAYEEQMRGQLLVPGGLSGGLVGPGGQPLRRG